MLSVGVIGLGYWGPNLVRNAAASPLVDLAYICDLDESRRSAIGRQHPSARISASPEELFADGTLDAVAIATPVATHYDLARAALLAGKHVLLEKPFVSTSDQGRDLIEIASANGLKIMVDHIFLFSPAVRKIIEVVRSGDLGDLLYMDSVRINLGLFQHDVDVLWDLAPHDLSIMDALVGREPNNVVAVGSSYAGDGLASVAYLHLDYGDGLIATVHANWMSPVKLRHFLVGGSRRSILYNDLDRSEPVKIYDRGVDLAPDPEGRRARLVSYRSGDVVSPKVAGTEPLRAMIEHFADCVENDKTPITGADQGLRVVRILEAAGQSMANGGAKVEL